MSVGRKSSADAASFLLTLMALKMCLLQRVMHPSFSLGTRLESISITSEFMQRFETIIHYLICKFYWICTTKIMKWHPTMAFWKINLMTLTCDSFNYTVRHLRDFFIYRNTQHLNGDPMQGSVTEHNNDFNPSNSQMWSFYLLVPCAQNAEKINEN